MAVPVLRALRPAATTSAFAGEGLRPRAAAPSRVPATFRTRTMAVRVCTVARRAPPRVAAGARVPRVSIARATRHDTAIAPLRAVRDPGVAAEQAADASAAVQPSGDDETRKKRVSSRRAAETRLAKQNVRNGIAFERGVPFSLGADPDGGDGAFYRAESAQARDLAVLLTRTLDRPRVLDAMAGSGVRSARYLSQGRSAHVHLNDASPAAADALLATLDALFAPPDAFGSDAFRTDASSRTEADDDDGSNAAVSSVETSTSEEAAETDEDASADDSPCDPNEAEDFASAVRCLPNPSEKPHPFKKTKRGKKTMSRAEKKALMESKMQRTKLFKLQKVTKKERKMRREAAAAASESESAAEPESESDGDDEARAIKKAMARAEAEKKKQKRKQKKQKRSGVVAETGEMGETVTETRETEATFADDEEEGSGSSVSSASRDASSLGTVSVTSQDARRLFASLFASGAERFDVVDVDSFGSETFVDEALRVTKLGGYCYATGTDALALCGKNPPRLMSQYGGAFVAPNAPAVNETALRVFVGDAVRRGAAQSLKVTPVFSLFHPHGPVFRAMLRVEKLAGAWDGEDIGFLAQCGACGETRRAEADELGPSGSCFCRRCAKTTDGEKTRMAVSGPLWTGPLHDAAAVQRLAREADEVDWCGEKDASSLVREYDDDERRIKETPSASSPKGQKASARELLAAFAAEADPALPPFYRRTDELARAGRGLKYGIPPLDAWIAELQRQGFAACRSHVDARGLKSNAPLDDVVAAANAVATAAKNSPASSL